MPALPIPCLSDNYAYAVFSPGEQQAVVLDPSEAEPIVACLEGLGLRLGGLLITHHHWDHVGGIGALLARYGAVPVVAHAVDASHLKAVNRTVGDGEQFEIAEIQFEAMHVPGHTLGALAYRWRDSVFTGDTLFAAGCGRLFEGTAAQMYLSLSRLAQLPPNTLMHCGHEYALKNLAFAAAIEPGNQAVHERIAQVKALRAAGKPSVPSTIGEECATNPFLRCDKPEFRQSVGSPLSGAELFAEIRKRRNEF